MVSPQSWWEADRHSFREAAETYIRIHIQQSEREREVGERGKGVRGTGRETGPGWIFEISKLVPNDTPPPVRLCLPIPPKQSHSLVTKHSNMRVYGGYSQSNYYMDNFKLVASS